MPIALYMDEHVHRAITISLRLRGVDVLTAQEDGMGGVEDSELLDRAAQLSRVLFTYDDDFLAEATKRQKHGIPFEGIFYAHPLRVSIGACVRELELIAKAGEPEDLKNRVEFLPH
jgi:hypothetical protein